jgi:predicted DNA-binding protein (MmcQ/YjbR family)
MQVEDLRRFCLALPEARENLQWGENLCFKVRGKLFAILDLAAVPQSLTLKSHPERFAELLECEGIGPAPYLGRYKWVQLESLEILPAEEMEDLLRQSYDLVSAKAKGRLRKKKKSPRKAKKRH